jgi:GT2 family glycosyltransferase
VEALAAALGEGVGAVGPALVRPDGAIESAGVRVGPLVRVRALRRARSGPVDALSGACLMLRPGLRFDEGYRHGFEDLALCRALWQAGLEVRLVAEARCEHRGGGTVSRRSAQAQRHAVAGHLRLWGGGWRSPLVVGLAFAQVVAEGGPAARLLGIAQGWRDWRLRAASSERARGAGRVSREPDSTGG